MSRYAAPTAFALSVWERLKGATSQRPYPHAEVMGRTRDLAPPDQIADALEALIDACLVATLRHTRDGVTQNVYWRTALKPITPPTQQELSAMSESKASRLIRLILLHGPITGPDLAAKATEEGGNTPAKNIPGLLASAINKGDIVVSKEGKTTTYLMPSQAGEAAPVAQASSLPPLKNAGALKDTAPSAGHALLLARIAEIQHELSAALADQKAESDRATGMATDLADICRALDVPHAGEAVEAIEHLEKLADAKAAKDFGDLAHRTRLLDEIGGLLDCDTYDSIPAALIERSAPPRGHLALLLMEGDHTTLHTLEPYVTEADAEAIVITQVNSGEAQTAYLVRALYVARRKIEHGAIDAPAVSTLHG